MILTPTTELEAVNEMLLCIDEAPVNTLDGISGLTDAAVARDVLRSVTRAVLARGWFFNQDTEYPITLNGAGEAVIPAGVLKIKPSRSESLKLIPRNGKLYNLEDRTYTLTAEPLVDIVWFLDFETLPETARHYITVLAARNFQTKVQGSDLIHSFTSQQEQEAFGNLQYEENQYARANWLNDASEISEIHQR